MKSPASRLILDLQRLLRIAEVLLLVLCVGAFSRPIRGQQAALAKMTLPQIEELVSHNVPDSTLSAQIEKRGISFAPTSATLDSLRSKGAGPLTLAALRRRQAAAEPEPHHSASVAETHVAKLTQAQLRHLIRIRASDSFVAGQIQSRGLDYILTSADVAALAAEGAGARTLELLRGMVVTGSIQIHSDPAASVSLDGRSVGMTDATGHLLLQDVLPGSHTLSLVKDSFHPVQQSLTLGDREAGQVSAPLSWAGAQLTISAEPSNATISVTGPVTYSGSLDSARCPPGNYTVTVSYPGYITQTQSFTVAANQTWQRDFRLLVDSALLAKSVAAAQGALAARDASSATRLATQVLSLDPSSIPAHKVLSVAAFIQGDFRSFFDNALAVIRGGDTITIPLLHVNTFPRTSIQQANVTISPQGLAFACTSDAKCKLPESLSYSIAGPPTIMNDPTGRTRMLHFAWAGGSREFAVVHQLDFVPLGSGMVKGSRSPNMSVFSSSEYLATPQNTMAEYDSIIRLLTAIR